MLKMLSPKNVQMSCTLARMIQVGYLEKATCSRVFRNQNFFSSTSTSCQSHHTPPPPCEASTPIQKIMQNKYSTDISAQSANKSEEIPASSGSQQTVPDSSHVESSEEDAESQVDKLYKTMELELLAYEPSVLDSYQWFVITAATHLNIKVGKCWSPLKSDKLRFSLLKSAFVHKKHQVQYEVRTYHRFIMLHKLTGSTADTFLEYIQRNLPEGVGMKITKVEVKPMPESLCQ